MTKSILAVVALVGAISQQLIAAEELTLGSNAPKLEVQKFIKGDPVKKFEKGKIYVVELWATWCGPCRSSIPHLTELQKKYEDVTFIGVAVLEEDADAVEEFVKEMGDKMDYRVALDLVPEGGEKQDGKLVKNWMEPAEQQGIPTAFVVNGDSKVAWIGHPMQMDEPLGQIVDGRWDLVAEAKKLADAKALHRKQMAIMTRLQKLYNKFNQDGESQELLEAIDSASKDLPEQAQVFQSIRFRILSMAKDRVDDALAAVNGILESDEGKDADFLNNIAWIVVDPDRESKADPKLLKAALKVALKADDLTNNQNPAIADTLAKAYFDNGDIDNAVRTQTRVVELAKGTEMAKDPGVKKRLRQYQRALEKATKSKSKDDDSSK